MVNFEAERNDNGDLSEERLEEKKVFSGKLLDVTVNRVRNSDGDITEREVVHHPGGVVVVPVIRENNGDGLVLVKQYREPAGRTLWEFPAGTLEPGETPEECARRELMEETNYGSEKFEKKVDLYTSPGYSDEVLSLYVASDLYELEDSQKPETPEDENLLVGKFSLEEIVNRARNGEIRDGKTLASLVFLS